VQETGADFPRTRWTLLVRAADRNSVECRAALDELIRAYWKPVYAYMRHRGISRETSADLTQEYFAAFLEQEIYGRFDREKGRFKTFVLATVKNFLSKQDRSAHAQKRGGGAQRFAGDLDEIEAGLARTEDPEASFHRQWAESVLEQAMARLAPDEQALLRAYLGGAARVSYSDLARSRSTSETDVRNALRRLRRQLKSQLLEVLRADVSSDRDLEAEMQELFLSL